MNITDIANRINPRRAQLAIAHTLAILGSAPSWHGDQISAIDDRVRPAWTGTDLPGYSDESDEAIEFWEQIATTAADTQVADPLTRWAEVFGDRELADEIAVKLTCGEAEITAAALLAAGNPDAARSFLAAHTARDTEDGETHSTELDL
ncbi:hypothetical protein [Williamsia sp.]|uniref:hypothetical protein n=1 Tax=Williamsia sp. TaxID=1872085 RepID=UPI002F94F506